MKTLLVTGSSGLIGSEVVTYFAHAGWSVTGADNNSRERFFGPEGDTRWNQRRLESEVEGFTHREVDIRRRGDIAALVEQVRPTAVVHAAAQPSHDLAAQIPFDDFETNAMGTLNLLEACRQVCPDAPFVFLSTNKVYGDAPNDRSLIEFESRWDYRETSEWYGVDESCRIDRSTHSLFGASKLAADVLVQEYGRYFSMPTACLRGGCLTGPAHSGVELHGFLSYLVKCNVEGRKYTVNGYLGKQVRDNIHALDVARFVEEFLKRPGQGEVYNIGGGRANSCSILEAFTAVENLTGQKMNWDYVDLHRVGDHICYISDLRKAQRDYPAWSISVDLPRIFEEIVAGWSHRKSF